MWSFRNQRRRLTSDVVVEHELLGTTRPAGLSDGFAGWPGFGTFSVWRRFALFDTVLCHVCVAPPPRASLSAPARRCRPRCRRGRGARGRTPSSPISRHRRHTGPASGCRIDVLIARMERAVQRLGQLTHALGRRRTERCSDDPDPGRAIKRLALRRPVVAGVGLSRTLRRAVRRSRVRANGSLLNP